MNTISQSRKLLGTFCSYVKPIILSVLFVIDNVLIPSRAINFEPSYLNSLAGYTRLSHRRYISEAVYFITVNNRSADSVGQSYKKLDSW